MYLKLGIKADALKVINIHKATSKIYYVVHTIGNGSKPQPLITMYEMSE
jgi:hypothetical protein